ncbi:extracellular matrix protein FRAS1-like [Megalops cyprinoides]|uniref:extracellular matrix protein FRAS1-like n=1 Tax=Megalops cyprinoides TaxID=118141 RepID=UPI0018653DB2|nr:extracellular matrix protein FRAS1-like [Megalops cyprinoides]
MKRGLGFWTAAPVLVGIQPEHHCPCANNSSLFSASCIVEGREYRDREEWRPSPCTKCVCSAGETHCFSVQCQPVVCQPHEKAVIWRGRCCPRCMPASCQAPRKEYKGQKEMKRVGQCCAACVPSSRSCLHQSVVRYHGDVWSNGCQFCTCDWGQVLCQQAECGRAECSQGEELVHLPGKCCPECTSVGQFCVHEDQRKEDLESWEEGPCRRCECRNGQVTCYQRSCPTCPIGTLAVASEGRCCPECHDVQCHPDCVTCFGTWGHCDRCKDPRAVLHGGRCLRSCPPGFYQNGRMCAACKNSCGSCENGFECTSCQKPLFMSRGQCVSTCGSGFFPSHTQCTRCHDSCSTCYDPGLQNCLSCSDPSLLLRDGLCMPECGPGFYTRQGTCHACDRSCRTCYPDSPGCTSCPPDTALHRGKCVLNCPEHHYRDNHGRCRECHSSCASCSGPMGSHCTLCPRTLALYLGQCLDACGQGWYSQDGVCQNCHWSCRSCVGPTDSDCVLCRWPEEALQPRIKGASHGTCILGCQDRFYLDMRKTCRECHSSCLQCTGTSAQDCTSCLPPAILHQGQCLHRCPPGFHSHNGTCNACHRSCRECSGPMEADCLACPPHAILRDGLCWTSCPEGQYQNALGERAECHAGCQRCVADTQTGGSVCLKCEGPRDLLLGDRCVSQCPSGYYTRNETCSKCHSSCESCSDEGPLSCTSCPAPLVLSVTGLCACQCLPGYYADEKRVCRACDRQCLTCVEAGVCTSCRDAAKVLLFGGCQYESCPPRHYLNHTSRTCRECDQSCVACRGPLHSDCLHCIEGYVLQGGTCIQGCATGSYQDGESCLGCDDRCEECEGPGVCRVCEQPFALLRGLCVQDCGRGFFMDSSARICSACPPHCVECEGSDWCTSCGRNTFLKSGLCTTDCGQGFYANTRTWTCQVNSQAPVLRVNGSLLVPIGGTGPLDLSVVTARDPDSADEDLVFWVVEPPSHGRLLRLGEGEGTDLREGDTFTLTDLQNGAVRFAHYREKSRRGRLILRVADPQLLSQAAAVSIQAVSLQPPVVLINRPLAVARGEAAVVGALVLWIEDDDNPEDVVVRVMDPPRHGRLARLHDDQPLRRFGLLELERRQLRYIHGGSSCTRDAALLQVTDGHNYLSLLLQVRVEQKSGPCPHIHSFSTAWVREGDAVQLSESHLRAERSGSSQSQILYSIVRSQESPKYGKVVLVPGPNESTDGWERLLDGRVATPTTSFTLQDLREGAVWYQHSGRGTERDSFSLQVSSEGCPDKLGDVHTFTIGVLPRSPNLPQLSLGSHLQLTALAGSVTVIQPSALLFVDADTPSDKLVYDITRPLAQGQGVIEHLDRPHAPVRFFTQADVDNGRILYRPPPASSHPSELHCLTFSGTPEKWVLYFTVSDGEHTTPELDFAILLLGDCQEPPLLQVLVPVLEVNLGDRAPVGGRLLAVSDADVAPAELRFELLDPPSHGKLRKVGKDMLTEMVKDDTFTFADITQNALLYEHGGGTTEADSMIFSVTDGTSMASVTVQVLVSGVMADGPRLDPDAQLFVEVPEKSSTVIRRAHLSYVSNGSSDEKIRIQLQSVAVYGTLTRMGSTLGPQELREGSSFTMEDIDRHQIRYITSTEIGSQPVIDIFHFTVYDKDNNHLDNQMCAVVILPFRKQPPVCMLQGAFKVQAGGRMQLSASNITAAVVDTPIQDRLLWLKSPPKYGFIKNIEWAGGSGSAGVITPEVPFPLEDLASGRLVYVQNLSPPATCCQEQLSFCTGPGPSQVELYCFSIVIQCVTDRASVISENNVLKQEASDVVPNPSLTAPDTPENEVPLEDLETPFNDHSRTPKVVRKRGLEENSVKRSASAGTGEQADLAAGGIRSSEGERRSDGFTFAVSDEPSEVRRPFLMALTPVGNSLPLIQAQGMSVQVGVRKTLTESDLKAMDADTQEDSITFSVVEAPQHGALQRTVDGQHYRETSTFTMEDVSQSRISYLHDGSKSVADRFTFTMTDGTNRLFVVEEGGKEVVTAAPQSFKIDILLVDDGTPRVVTNLGLQWLEYIGNKVATVISKKELLAMDPDTDDAQLVYEVTTGPKHGFLESSLRPGTPISNFTQADINLGLIHYVLHEENIEETADNFTFLVKGSKPAEVTDNTFHIWWSLITFEHSSYNVSELAGSVVVTVKRTGSLSHYAMVLCHTEPGSATSDLGSSPGKLDYTEHYTQVQFNELEDTKVCTVEIEDDRVFEGMESFGVELSVPMYALLGMVTRVEVQIQDPEDEPTLQFQRQSYHVSEDIGTFSAPIQRKGDTSSTVSVLCHTVPKSATGSSLQSPGSGSDFATREVGEESRVVLGPGMSEAACDVRLLDDREYEQAEEFELILSHVSNNARLGDVTVTKVVIDGPNDAAAVFLGSASFTYSEDAGTIEIPLLRAGSDLSSVTSVWCATRPSDPLSATPGIDYIPSSKRVEFKPGKTEETCSLTIVDDTKNPTIEGVESFVVFLSSAQGAVLTEPSEASVFITDTSLDIPSMQFEKSAYWVKEEDGVLNLPIVRSGDVNLLSSVRCYTRTMSSAGLDDFAERRNTEKSRVTFLKGERVKNCTIQINDDSVFEPKEEFHVHLGTPLGDHWSGAAVGRNNVATVTITNDEDAPTIEFEEAAYQIREPPSPDGTEALDVKVIRRGDQNRTSKVRCSTRDGSAQSGVDYSPKNRVLKFSPGMDHIYFKTEILSNEAREWHKSFSLVLGPDEPSNAVLGEITMATVTILDQDAAGSLILPAPPIVVSLLDYDCVEEASKEGSRKSPSQGYPLVCVTPCDQHYPKYSTMRERCEEAGINQTSVRFSWEVAAPTDSSGFRSPFETVTDNTPFTSVNHMVLDSIYFSRRFHVRCVAQALDKAGHFGTPLRSNVVTIGTEGSICHTPVAMGTTRGFQAQSFIATLKYLDVKHKEHPNRIHISVQIPHQDGMLPLVSTMPLHNLHFLLSEPVYRQQHFCSNLVTLADLQGISETGFLADVPYERLSLGPGYDRPYQFNPKVREPRTIQLYKHLNLKSCVWTFDAYYDMTELIDVCGGSVTADFQVRDSAQSFLTVQVPLYVSYVYVTTPRGWASLEHHTQMEFSFFYDTVLWRTGIQTDSVLSARLQIARIYIRDDGRLVVEFKTHAKFRGQFVLDHHTLPGRRSHLMAPEHLGNIDFDLQLLWSAQTFDSPHQLWKATSSYSRKDYSGEYTVFLIPCTVQPTQPWVTLGDKPLPCTAHAPEKFIVPIAFQQTNRPVPVVYSLNTEFQLCNNQKVFMMNPASADMSLAEMDYKGAFSIGQTLYGRVLWNPEQSLNTAYRLQLEKVYLCTGRDGYVPFFDPTGTLYNEGPQYGCIQPNKHLRHRFLLLDRQQPEVCDRYFHDVPFEAAFASDRAALRALTLMPGIDGFTMKVDALYKVEAGHQWYLQVIYVIRPESAPGLRVRRSLMYGLSRGRRDLADRTQGRLTLDESLVYDNEGDQVKNGTNMKTLRLEVEPEPTFDPHTGGSIGGGVAAVTLVVLILLSTCLLFKKCRLKKRTPTCLVEEYPLNTKVEVCLEKNFSSMHCTVRKVNILNVDQDASNVKVKQVNLEVKLHKNFVEGTEV